MGSVILSVVLLAALQVPVPPPPPPPPPTQGGAIPRDAARDTAPPSGTAIIRGKVTDQETGEPIPRAIVSIMPSVVARPDPTNPQFTRPLQATTASDGRFEFKNLAAGDYRVSVAPGEFRASHLSHMYGVTGPMDMTRPRLPKPLTLREGEVRDDVNVTLWRAFAIEGRVSDEFGEPMAGVEVLAKSPDTGQRNFRSGPQQMITDDRGMFRLFGLAPGRYIICANPRNFGMPSTADVKERAIQTCHPAAVIDADAVTVTLTNGDIGGIDIRIQRSRAFTASGVAVDSAGAPLAQNQVNVVRIDRTGGGTSSSGIELQPGGRFIARGLTPGEYAVHAQVGAPFNQQDSGREREMGYLPFRIENADVEGLVVTTSKTAKINGRIIFEDEPPTASGVSMRVSTMPDMANRMFMMGPPAFAQVKPDLTFELSGLFGPLTVQIGNPPRGWIAKSIRFKGEDIIDTLYDFTNARASDPMEIVLTNRGARISGRVTNDRGEAASEVMLLLIPADPARRRGFNPMGFGGMSPKPDGSYQIGPVRAGEYFLAAIALEDYPRIGPGPDMEFFERLARVAQRITLVESEQQTIDLRVAKIQ